MRRWSGGWSWLLVVGFVAALLLRPGVGLAQTEGSGTVDSIRGYMEKGQGLYLAKDYAAAVQQFDEGYASHPYSAFLFNAGVCYQKLDQLDVALVRFRGYVEADPNAPDVEKVKERIALLAQVQEARRLAAEAQAAAAAAAVEAGTGGAGGTGGEPATVPVVPPLDVPVVPSDDESAMRALVVVETEPAGAPVRIYAPLDAAAGAFVVGAENPRWKRILASNSPVSAALPVGRYHVVIDKFRDFNTSDTVIQIRPGHVYQFKANLSQGAFMSFLRVVANVRDAYIYLDDDKKAEREWGVTPYGALIPAGEHSVLVESPGFQPFRTVVDLKHGEQMVLDLTLARVNYGFLRVDADAPEVKIQVDGKPLGVWRHGDQPLDIKVASGEHRLEIEADGRKTFEGTVSVPSGLVLPVHAKMIEKYPRGAAWTQSIIAAALLGGGIYLGVESDRLNDQLAADREAGVLTKDDSRATKGKWFAIGADVSFVLGGLLGALATYNFIKDPRPESSTRYGGALEFPDPKALRPRAELDRPEPWRDLRVGVGATAEGGSIAIGGRF